MMWLVGSCQAPRFIRFSNSRHNSSACNCGLSNTRGSLSAVMHCCPWSTTTSQISKSIPTSCQFTYFSAAAGFATTARLSAAATSTTSSRASWSLSEWSYGCLLHEIVFPTWFGCKQDLQFSKPNGPYRPWFLPTLSGKSSIAQQPVRRRAR